jgi:hypothetical protein
VVRDLVGRVKLLDPEVTESLQVVVFFDSLVESRANLDAFLRGAAALTGCATGIWEPRHRLSRRVAPDGTALPPRVDSEMTWPTHKTFDEPDGLVWIERVGESRATDSIVLERLAAGCQVTLERAASGWSNLITASVNTLFDPASDAAARLQAGKYLGLTADSKIRVVAVENEELGVPGPTNRRSRRSTDVGEVLMTVVDEEQTIDGRLRAGVSTSSTISDIPQLAEQALTALRFGLSDATMWWENLGAIVLLASSCDQAALADHPDIVNLRRIISDSGNSYKILHALATTDTVRSAASALRLHHSTVQHRSAQFEELLGFDPRESAGRRRLWFAMALERYLYFPERRSSGRNQPES